MTVRALGFPAKPWRGGRRDEDGGTLRHKAAHAERVCAAYALAEMGPGEELATVMGDLLIDLRHLAAQQGVDMEAVLAKSERFFIAERDGVPVTEGIVLIDDEVGDPASTGTRGKGRYGGGGGDVDRGRGIGRGTGR